MRRGFVDPVRGAVGVDVQWGSCPDAILNPTWTSVCCTARAGLALCSIPGIARYLIRDGRSICVDPVPGADPAAIGAFFRFTALPALLCQRGALLVRGSAVRTPHGAALILGPVASGKSVAAAALHAAGYPLVADGFCEIRHIDGRAMVMPGSGHLHLWQRDADALGVDRTGLVPERSMVPRFAIPMPVVGEPLAVTRLFHLLGTAVVAMKAPLERLEQLMACDHDRLYLGGVNHGPAAVAASLALAGLETWAIPRAHPDRPAEAAGRIAGLIAR